MARKQLVETDMGGNKLSNVGTPTNTGDAVNKSYADGLVGATVTRVVHGANAATARPNVTYVEWVGSVAPTNGTANDTWIDTTTP